MSRPGAVLRAASARYADAYRAWSTRLGLGLDARLAWLTPDRIHRVPRGRQHGPGALAADRAGYAAFGHVYVGAGRGSNPPNVLAHEYAHLLGAFVLVAGRDGRAYRCGAVAAGLMPALGDGAFHLVNELVTDLVKIDALAAHPATADEVVVVQDPPMLLLLDELLRQGARRVGAAVEDLWTRIARGYVLGDPTVLAVLAPAFGDRIVDVLADLEPIYRADDLLDLAARLGTDPDSLRRRLVAVWSGEDVALLGARRTRLDAGLRTLIVGVQPNGEPLMRRRRAG
jgi:hypothetical protein